MKKPLVIFGVVLVAITLFVWFVYMMFTVKIRLSADNVLRVSIIAPGTSLDTKDKDKIIKVISSINGIRYYKGSNFEIYNNSPDVFISLYDKGGKKIDEMRYYGDVVVYKDSKYGIIPFTAYSRIENLCKNFRERQ